MTKRLKVYLLIVFAAACLACTLVGCKVGGPGRAEILAGYDSHVTYYSNGGSFNESSTTTVMEIYYKAGTEGVPFFNVTSDTETTGLKVERKDYDLIGWYEPERYTEEDVPDSDYVEVGDIKFVLYTLDENGNIAGDAAEGESVFPLKNSKGGYITDSENDRPMFARMNGDGTLKDEQIPESRVTVKFDENKLIAGIDEEGNEINNLTVKRDDVIDVCAAWERRASVSYKLVITDEDGNKLTDKEGDEPKYYYATKTDDDGNKKRVRYKYGSQIDLLTIHGDSATVMDRAPVTIEGLTFVRTYMDENLTVRAGSVARPQGDEEKTVDVYCRYIVGDWTVVTAQKSTEVKSEYEGRIRNMFLDLYEENKYLIIDDIDCTGFAAFPLKFGDTSDATIVVDGNSPLTISNLSFTVGGKIGNGLTYSIFGDIGADFKVKGAGLIIKDTVITLQNSTYNYNFYAICESADLAASENVNLTIDTVTVTYQLTDAKINGVAGGGTVTHWMFGGAASDAAFLEQFTGIKIAEGDNSSISERQ